MNEKEMTWHLTDETKDMSTLLALIRTIDAEKRTHLAELRTGIGILTVPMAPLTIFITTSEFYVIESVQSFVFAVVIGIVLLSSFGIYLVLRSMAKFRADEGLRRSYKDVACLLDEYNNSE